MIAFLGMGLLGSNFVRALRRRGESVRVWSRAAAKAEALAETGAFVERDPAEAARGADRVHLTLSDDAAVDEVLARAEAGFSPGLTILDHTTTSVEGAKERISAWQKKGIVYCHAPVFMGPQNAHDGTGLMLVAGEAALVDKVRPWLTPMTGRLVELGTDPARPAAMKLLGNLFLMFMTGGLAEVFSLGKALSIQPEDAAALFEAFNPGAMLPARAKRMIEVNRQPSPPSWELTMARKDARIMMEEAARHGVALPMLPAIAAEMDRFIAGGHGGEDWTVIGRDAFTR